MKLFLQDDHNLQADSCMGEMTVDRFTLKNDKELQNVTYLLKLILDLHFLWSVSKFNSSS